MPEIKGLLCIDLWERTPEEVAQGDYSRILAKEQRRQEQLANEQAEQKRLQAEQAKQLVRQQEIDYFLTHVCPNPNNPENYDIDTLDEYFEWKWQDTGKRDKYGDWIFEHTTAYKEFLKN